MRLAALICLLALPCFGVNRYIDPAGSDSTGDGSAGNPWQSPWHAFPLLSAGDTCYLNAGVYANPVHSISTGTAAGTPANPITVIGLPGSMIIDSGIYVGSSNWTFQSVLLSNVWQAHHTKTDTFGTQNGARTGDWANMWGVGYENNYDMQKTNITASGDFTLEFAGVNCFQPAWVMGFVTDWKSQQCNTNYGNFVAYAAADSGGVGVGNGDYHLQSVSPFCQSPRSPWLVPVDVAGQARGIVDPPGAHAVGNVRKGVVW